MLKKSQSNFRRKLIFVIVFSILSFSILPDACYLNAQSSAVSSQQKKAGKKKEEQKKKSEKAKSQGIERQKKIQTKETRKRMKKHRKQTTTPYKKPNFFQRLFGKKH